MKIPQSMRADEFLVSNGFAESKTKAQAMIFAHQVRISNDDVIDKPSRKVPLGTQLHIETGPQFVSRGGEKLEGFFRKFPINVKGESILDIGASTGGFTDCLLQYGAAHATCIDVGHGQLHYKLQKDPRVKNFENINARDLSLDFFSGNLFDFVVCDVSFISLKKILPIIWQFVAQHGYLIALIKPQFEAEKSYIDRCKGVIKDSKMQEEIRQEIVNFATKILENSQLIGNIESPLLGTDGNKEFLFAVQKSIHNPTNPCIK